MRLLVSLAVLAAAGPLLFGGNVVESIRFSQQDEDASALEAGITSVELDVAFPYTFAEPHNIDASAPVMDHMVPDTVSNLNEDKPAFLYDGHQPSRLVLFYGDYCDTMKEFKPNFIRWAKELQAIAEAHNEFVMTYAVSCRPNRQLCLDQAAHEFPFLRLLKKNELVGRDLSYRDLTFSNAFRELGFNFEVEKDQNAWTMAGSLGTSPPPSRPLAQFSIDFLRHQGQSNSMSVVERRQALMDDVHLSLDFMLRNALFTEKKALSKERKRRFLKFLRLMTRTLPAKWALQELLSVLLKDFEYITERETYLLPILDRYPPRQKTWSPSCTKGKLGHAHSCGMWKLYHAMSVGLVRFNSETNEERRYSTNAASEAIMQFIQDNERCVDCRDNSLQSFNRCDYGRCHILSDVTKGSATNLVGSWAQLSVWLANWHNGVNKMVLKRQALAAGRNVTLADEIGVLWPPQSECLPCWKKDRENGPYQLNPTMTFNWLKAEYGPNDVEVQKAEKYIMALHRKEARRANRAKNTIRIAQSSILALVMAGIWAGARAKAKRATTNRKKDDGDASSNDNTDRQ